MAAWKLSVLGQFIYIVGCFITYLIENSRYSFKNLLIIIIFCDSTILFKATAYRSIN